MSDDGALGALGTLVVRALSPSGAISRIDVAPFPAPSTHRLDAVDVRMADGTTVSLVAKHIHLAALPSPRHGTRTTIRHDLMRERVVYERFLRGCEGAPRLLVADASVLVLERARGVPLVETGRIDAWCAAAACLARLHGRGTAVAQRRPPWTHRLVVEHIGDWRRLCERAGAANLAAAHAAAVSRLAVLPWTLAHGDCHPANVIADLERYGVPGVAFVDWGAATLAPGLLDLAALVSGDWAAGDRAAMAGAYRDAARDDGWAPAQWFDDAAFAHDVAAARVHLAVEHAAWRDSTRDWLADARAAAQDVA